MTNPTIIIEMENARQVSWDEVRGTIEILEAEVAAHVAANAGSRPQVVFVQSGTDADTPLLADGIRAICTLDAIADLEFASVPEGRYYELKNEGIRLSRGDPLVFLDSDTVPEPGWLATLIAPLADPSVTAVNGYTYLFADDFMSRVYALIWLFPMRDHDGQFAGKRALNANNAAFRRDWITANPFPRSNGFKVSCTLLEHRFRGSGRRMVRADACVGHPAPRGKGVFVWRALVTGRDADRKFAALRSPARSSRALYAASRWCTMMWRVSRRVLGHFQYVGMPVWQVPAALIGGMAFYTIAAMAQFGQAVGATRDQVEFVPTYVEHS